MRTALGVFLVVLLAACGSESTVLPSSGGAGGAGHSGTSGDSGANEDSGASGDSGGASSDSGTAEAGGDGNSGGTAGAAGGAPEPPSLGVYCGNEPTEVTQFEDWLGRDADGVLGYTGGANWDDFDGSVGWAAGLWEPLNRRVFWSVPLIPEGASLASAAAGEYNDHYSAAAEKLAGFRPQDDKLFIRTGWEFNGDWFPWAAQSKEQDFIGAFREFVTAFRSVSDRFVFEWNVNIGSNTSSEMNPEDACPGDAYVDFIGMDFYWNTTWDPTDPVAAWESMRDRPYGLTWHQEFALAHGKRTTYSEWGIMSDGAGPYIERAQQWFEQHDVVFHTYWNSNSAFQGKLSGGQYPTAGATFIQVFGSN